METIKPENFLNSLALTMRAVDHLTNISGDLNNITKISVKPDSTLNAIALTTRAVDSMVKGVTGSREDIIKKAPPARTISTQNLSAGTKKQIGANEEGKGNSVNASS